MAVNWKTRLIHSTWNHDDVPYTYGTYGTPTTLELAARIAELGHGYRCFITPGGLSALVVVYLSCLASGDHVLVPQNVYGPSRAFADQVLRRYAVEVEYYPPLNASKIASQIRSNTRLIWCESLGSITMEIPDVPAIVEAAHQRDVLVAPGTLSNTWKG